MYKHTLLRVAKGDLKACNLILAHAENDVDVRLGAYHLQQAVEKILKHALNVRGIKHPHTHDVVDLCKLCIKEGVSIPYEVLINSPKLTEYAIRTRWSYNYKVDPKELFPILKRVTVWVEEFDVS